MLQLHSVLEYKKRYKRNYAQILENLRNAIVGVFGLRNEFKNVHGNKKRNTGGVKGKFALTIIFTLLTQQSTF